MIEDIIITYNDSPNEESKHFFETCADIIRQKAVDAGINYHNIDNSKLNNPEIENKINTFNSTFILSAFSHGSKTALHNHELEEYISTQTNNYIFSGNIVYTFACECGCDLKEDLERKGVASFWGYTKKVKIRPYDDRFITCATEGLVALLEGNTLEESKNRMIDKYDKAINSLYQESFLQAAFLLENKESFVVYGNDGLNIYKM